MGKKITHKKISGARKYFIVLNQILIILSALFFINCSQIPDSHLIDNAISQQAYFATNNGVPYGNFILTINGDQILSYPLSKNYTNTYWLTGLTDGTYTIQNIVNRFKSALAASDGRKATCYLNILNVDFYQFSSNTILTISVHDGLFDLKIESVSLTEENKGPKIELILKDLQVSDINNELTLDSSTPNRVLKYFSTSGYVYSSNATGSSVKLTVGNIGELNDETTVTINNSTLYKDGGGIESISLSGGSINGYRKEVTQ